MASAYKCNNCKELIDGIPEVRMALVYTIWSRPDEPKVTELDLCADCAYRGMYGIQPNMDHLKGPLVTTPGPEIGLKKKAARKKED